MTTDAIARRMSVNHGVCQSIDLERTIGDVMRCTSGPVSWLALVADRFGDLAKAVYCGDQQPEPSLLRLAACCHAWLEAIQEERAR